MDRNREIPPEALWDQPTQIFEARVIQERGVARARAKAAVAAYGSPIPPNLSRMLLPGEMLTLASRPHPIVFLVPSLAVLAVAIVFGVVLTSGTQQIVHGHWVDVPWVGGWMRTAVAALGGAALLRGLLSLARAASYYLGFHVVTTNRRAFVVEGVLARRVRPLGNGVMAAASLTQTILGRIGNFGTITMDGTVIRDLRDAVGVYREFQAVANGVDGDRWAPAVRQTRIP